MKPGSMWPVAIFGLIGLNVVIVGVTIYFATSDPSAAVEPDYYQKALAWDQTAKLRDASARLGWKALAVVEGGDRLVLKLVDAAGAPVADAQVAVTAFAVARAANRQELTLTQGAPGVYGAPVRIDRGGLWQVRVEAKRGEDVFACTIEQEMAAATKGAAEGAGGVGGAGGARSVTIRHDGSASP